MTSSPKHNETLEEDLAILFDEEEPVPLLLRKRFVFGLVIGFLLVVALYLLAASLLGLSFEVEAEPLRDWVNDRGPFAPLFFIGIMAGAVFIAPIPNVPVFIAAGLVWGPVEGSIYSITGLMLGSVLAFLATRYFGRRYLRRLVGAKTAHRLDTAADDFGGRLVFWARLLPATNFDWVSLAAGMTSIRFRTFFVYSLLGISAPTALTVTAGDSLAHDFRVTLALSGVWVLGVVVSAAYIWRRHTRG